MRNRYLFLHGQYDEDKEIAVEIFGNYYLSNEIILKILNNEEYESDYNFLLNEMKIVTVSDKEKIILIKENRPIFYDKKSLYLSSKKRIKSDIDILNKKNLIFLSTDLKEIPDPFIRKMESFTDQIKNDYELFPNYKEQIELLKKEGFDILLYMEVGMTMTSQLLASHRIAPIQVSIGGHPITTGIDTMDYYIIKSADINGNITPLQNSFSEKLIDINSTLGYVEKKSIMN